MNRREPQKLERTIREQLDLLSPDFQEQLERELRIHASRLCAKYSRCGIDIDDLIDAARFELLTNVVYKPTLNELERDMGPYSLRPVRRVVERASYKLLRQKRRESPLASDNAGALDGIAFNARNRQLSASRFSVGIRRSFLEQLYEGTIGSGDNGVPRRNHSTPWPESQRDEAISNEQRVWKRELDFWRHDGLASADLGFQDKVEECAVACGILHTLSSWRPRKIFVPLMCKFFDVSGADAARYRYEIRHGSTTFVSLDACQKSSIINTVHQECSRFHRAVENESLAEIRRFDWKRG
jgi:hypothetical protein